MASEAETKPEEVEEKKEEAEVKDESKEDAKLEPKDEDDQVKEETGEPMDADDTKEPAKMQEETDAPEDTRPKVDNAAVFWSAAHSTCNAMPTADGKVLMTLNDVGFQYLLAGVRCSVGMKAGRYLLECKIIESISPMEQRPSGRTQVPTRQILRIGVSSNPNSQVLDDSSDKVFFDSEGYFVHGRKRSRASAHLSRDQVIGLLLNLDAASPNANTICLFRDGQRVSDPQPLPEELVGKVLYPCITWKNFTMQVNLGPTPKKPLPFVCRMLNDAAAADLEVTPASKAEKNEVLFPVGLPEQGVFDWLDGFLEGNQQHVELSDRKVIEWARQSGAYNQKGYSRYSESIDKPGINFGIPLLDDMSIQKTLAAVAPALKKDFVHMELRSNLVAAERKKALTKFPSSSFKRVAVVVMGEPPDAFKAKTQEWMLADKVEEESYKAAKRRRMDDPPWNAPKKEEKKDAEKEDDANDGVDEKGEGEQASEAPKKEDAEDEAEEKEKPVELTEEEKNTWYYKRNTPDLSQAVLAKSFASFSLPSKEDGFDEIRYVWQPEDKCAAHMKSWMLDLKKTQRAEDLEPSKWFKDKYADWTSAVSDWKRKQNEARDKVGKTAKTGDEPESKKEEKDKEDEDDEDEEGKEEKAAEEEVDVDKVENIDDIGEGKPLYADFIYEDWVLLELRYQFHLLIHAFKKDLDDPDRPGFAEAHLAYYFDKYYRKEFNLKWYGMKELSELNEVMKDTWIVNEKSGFLEAVLPADEALDKFMRLTEENRRERQRCIDAGDETANLKFERPSYPQASRGGDRGGGGYRGNKGGGKSGGGGGGGRHDRGAPVGGRGPPPRGAPPPRGRDSYSGGGGGGGSKGGSRGGDRRPNPPPPSRGGGGYGASSQGQKRPMPPPAPASKQPRYGGGGGGGGGGGRSSGGRSYR